MGFAVADDVESLDVGRHAGGRLAVTVGTRSGDSARLSSGPGPASVRGSGAK